MSLSLSLRTLARPLLRLPVYSKAGFSIIGSHRASPPQMVSGQKSGRLCRGEAASLKVSQGMDSQGSNLICTLAVEANVGLAASYSVRALDSQALLLSRPGGSDARACGGVQVCCSLVRHMVDSGPPMTHRHTQLCIVST